MRRLDRLSALVALMLFLSAPLVWAHAEHGSGEPVPQVSKSTRLPGGVSLAVVKTTAYQFSLSSDGQQDIEVLSDEGEPFIRISRNVVLANINSVQWYRSMQPGGGLVPARLKSGEPAQVLKADWQKVAEQAGFGWYDARLVNESLDAFKLQLRINGKRHVASIERKPLVFAGYWSSQLNSEPQTPGLSALIPGLSTGALSLTRDASDRRVLEVLDASGTAFLRSTPEGYWVNSRHPWFKELGLHVNTQSPQLYKGWPGEWVMASTSRMLTYQDPRLKAPEGSSRAARKWSIPVRVMDEGRTESFRGEMVWRGV